MSATDRFLEMARWLRYAEEDLITAETLLGQPHVAPRHACWFAQQAAEKALKAVLILLQIDFPRTHDLDTLHNLVPDGWQFKDACPDLASLTEWAVEARYPGDWLEATDAEAATAVGQARVVWESISTELTQQKGTP